VAHEHAAVGETGVTPEIDRSHEIEGVPDAGTRMADISGTALARAGVVLAFVLAFVAVWAMDRPRGAWGRRLRTRFLMGVPWGTLTAAAFVTLVYLFVQGGLDNWAAPTVLPFRAWSYLYPLGMATASFAHSGPGHLIGNLVGTLTLAPLAEYAYGHFPRERGRTSFSSLRRNPFVRAFVVVPGAVVVAGLLTSAFSLGPIVGFSGVVFAFAGFALVYYPLGTVIALAGGRVVRLAYNALRDPTFVAKAEPTFSTPWWATIAIQGHALGLALGVVAGVLVARRRDVERPDALRVWIGVVLFSVSQSLWAVYWYRGADTYVLFRAVGAALVVVLAAIVTLAVAGSDRSLRPDAAADSLLSVERWQVGLAILAVGVAAISGPAIPYNVVTAGDEPLPGDGVTVEGYEVTYAENVQNGQTAVFEVDAFGESTAVNTSGVLVRNPDRAIWTTAVSKERLAFAGRSVVRVGGVGWRKHVVAVRRGWRVSGGNVTYRVSLRQGDDNRTVYRAPPATAEPVLDGANVSVLAGADSFELAVARGEERATAPIPPRNESVVLGGIQFSRNDSRVIATYDGSRVPIASVETYRGQEN